MAKRTGVFQVTISSEFARYRHRYCSWWRPAELLHENIPPNWEAVCLGKRTKQLEAVPAPFSFDRDGLMVA
jgi:hypothetical protein